MLRGLSCIMNGGQKLYRTHVIEFQKRGLAHAHIAVKFEKEPLTMDKIDKVLSAHMPNVESDLWCLVQKQIIHKHHPKRCFKNKGQEKTAFTFARQQGLQTKILGK